MDRKLNGDEWKYYPYNIPDYDPLVDTGRQNIFETFVWPAQSDFFSLDVKNLNVYERHVQGPDAVRELLQNAVPLRVLFCESRFSSNIRTPFAADDAKKILSAYNVKPNFLFSSVGAHESSLHSPAFSGQEQPWSSIQSFWYYLWCMDRSIYVYVHHDRLQHQTLVIYTHSNIQDRAPREAVRMYNDLRATVRNAISQSLAQGKNSVYDPFAVQIPALVFTELTWTQQASLDYASVEQLESLIPQESVMKDLRSLATRIHLSKNSINILQYNCRHLLSVCSGRMQMQMDNSEAGGTSAPSPVTNVLNSLILRTTATLCTVDSNLQRAQAAVDLGMAQLGYTNGQTTASIARAARTDAISMQTIAFVTLAFLPGTYVAAFCSMSFFQNVLQLAQLWLYFVVAIPLTGAILGIWWFWLKRRLDDTDVEDKYIWGMSTLDVSAMHEKEL